MTEGKRLLAFNTCHVAGFTQALEMSLDIDWPLLALGTFGIGKSEIIRQVGERRGYAVLDGIRVAQLLPEDAGGLVSPGEATYAGQTLRVVDRLMPDIIAKVWQLREDTGKPVLLFLDELTQGAPSIVGALYGLVLERCAAGYMLPPHTRIIAAGNTLEDRGVAYEMPKPMANRFMIVKYLGPTFAEWEAYALQHDAEGKSRSIHPTIMTFLKQQPEYVCGKINVEDDEGRTCTPRSWAATSRMLHAADARGSAHTDRMFLVASIVGDHAALQMEAFLKLAEKMPTFEEVMADPAKARLDATDVAASYMATTMLVNRVVKPEQFDKGYKYVSRMREEMMAVYLRMLMTSPKFKLVLGKNRELFVKHSDVLGAGAELTRRSA